MGSQEFEEFKSFLGEGNLRDEASEVLFDAEMIMLDLGDGRDLDYVTAKISALALGQLAALLLCYAGKYENYEAHPIETLHAYRQAQQEPMGLQ